MTKIQSDFSFTLIKNGKEFKLQFDQKGSNYFIESTEFFVYGELI